MDPEIAGQIALSKVHGRRILEMANREAQQVLGGAGYQRGGLGASIEQTSRDLRMMVSQVAECMFMRSYIDAACRSLGAAVKKLWLT